jgi:Excalibur calcium-binding domain
LRGRGAHDRTRGKPVTTFERSTRLYETAMKANSRLDGDRDGIACERR